MNFGYKTGANIDVRAKEQRMQRSRLMPPHGNVTLKVKRSVSGWFSTNPRGFTWFPLRDTVSTIRGRFVMQKILKAPN